MKKLNFIQITSLYVGCLMGAGFASGRECWQYFGVFGKDGYNGIYAVSIIFIVFSCMLSYIAISKNTKDLGALISPVENKFVVDSIGIVMAAIYYSMIIAMTAAGGSLLNQQFSIHKAIGGITIAVLCIVTVLGDFQRVSKVFSLLVPVLFVFGILVIFLAIRADFGQSGAVTGYEPGDMTPTWPVAAIVFCAYNCMGMVTMAGSSAISARDNKNAYLGAIVGSLMLGVLTLLLLKAMLTDMAFSCSLDLPMLGFAARISTPLNICYSIVLYGAVYSCGASTYYGFSTKIPDSRYKKGIIIAGALIGFLIGLSGFKVIVEYLYSVQGYIGMIFFILVIINFLNEIRKNINNKSVNL